MVENSHSMAKIPQENKTCKWFFDLKKMRLEEKWLWLKNTFGEKLYLSSLSRHLIINISICTFESIKNHWIIYGEIANPMIVQTLLGKL